MRKIISFLLIFFYLLGIFFINNIGILSVTNAEDSNYYISSSSGSDTTGDGSLSSPWATINHALDLMNGGDTLKIDAGTYNEAVTIPRGLSGSSGAETTIEPWHDGDEVIIAYSSVLDHAVTINASYLIFRNIEIDATAAGVSPSDEKHQCLRVKPAESDPYNLSNVLISGVELYGCRSHGLQIIGDIVDDVNYTASYVTVENCSIHDTNMQNEDMGDGSSWGSALKIGTDGHHITLRNNAIYDNWGEGIDVAKGYYVDIIDNVSYNNLAPDIYIDNSYEVNVEGNFTYCYDFDDPRTIRDGDRVFTSISIAEEDYDGWTNQLHDVNVINNISYNCKKTFGIYGPERDDNDVNRQNIVIAHNTFYTDANTSSSSISIERHPTDDITFKNNISGSNPDLKPIYESGDFSGSAVYSNNIWIGSNPSTALQTNNILTTESEMNFVITPTTNSNSFKMLAGSVAVDAGIDVGVTDDFDDNFRPQGTGYDIGAFEIDTTGDTTAPILTEITPVADPTSDSTPSYTFHTDESGTIEYSGDCSSFTTKALEGNNTIIFNKLSNGTHTNCKITVTDTAGNVGLLYISDFEVKVESEPIFNTDRVFKQLIGTTCGKTFWDIVGHQFEDSIKKVACAEIVSGYKEDDSFRPDNNITRLEVTKVLAKAFGFTAEYPTTKQFTDVEKDEWYSKYLYPLSQEGAFGGYKDGSFQPYNNITRAEFVKAALKASAIEVTPVLNSQFFDVHPEQWYAKYIVRANKLGIINGYKDGNFRPLQPITRGEVAKIMTRILELQ